MLGSLVATIRIACLIAVLAACGSTTPVAPPPPAAPASVALGPFSAVVPTEWTVKPTTSKMRAADYTVPGDAEVIVYYFGEHGAGTIDDNVERWLGQFTQPDGKPTRDVATIEKVKLAGNDATLVAVSGHYVAMAVPGMDAVDKPGAAMVAAIVASPSGPYYFRLIGGKSTVDANAAKFRAMLSSLALR
jgi:5-enolpyruvylshikimate-3-phosphate synthase